MKKFHKILFAGAVTLALGSGAAFSYLQVQPAEQLSDLTLDNIEVMGVPCQPETTYDSKEDITIITVCGKSTTFWEATMGIWCQSSGSGSCSVEFRPM